MSIKQLLPNNGISEKALVVVDGFMVKNCWRLRFPSTKNYWRCLSNQNLLEIFYQTKIATFCPPSIHFYQDFRDAVLRFLPLLRSSQLEIGRRENLPVVKGSMLTGTRKEGLDIPDSSKNYWLLGTSNSPLGEPIYLKKNFCKHFDILLAWQ